MKGILALLTAIGCIAISGCSKNAGPAVGSASSDDPANPSSSQPGAAKAPPAKMPGSDKPLPPPPLSVTAHAQNAPAENVVGDVDPFLTEQLRIFMQQKRRLPQSFAELASVRLDSMPNPPLGKKWVIDAATQQVKAVPAR
jgi:hypothetical protein